MFKFEYVNKLKITVTAILIILISAFAFVFKDVFKYFENKTIDMRSALCTDSGLFSHKFAHADEDIVIVSVNDLTQYEAARSSELNLTRWPWSREVWAKFINFMEAQKPRLLVVDLNFSNYEDLSRNVSSPDNVLAATLGTYDNIILATALRTPFAEAQRTDTSKILDNFANPFNPSSDALAMYIPDKKLDNNISYYSHTPIPNIFTNSTTMAATNLVTGERHENVRFSQPVYKLVKGNKEYYIPSIGLAALLKNDRIGAGTGAIAEEIPIENNTIKIGKHLIRVDENGQSVINWHGNGNSYLDIPINSLLLSMVREAKYFEFENTKYPLNFFKDKIVIVAQTQLNSETHNTPVAKEMTDAEIKATIIDNYLHDSDVTDKYRRPFLKKINPYKGIILTVCFCMAIIFVVAIATNFVLAAFNGSLLVLIYIILSVILFAHPRLRIILDMAMPLYFMISTYILSYVLKVHHEYKKRKKIETIFGNLVSEHVLKQLVNKPHRLNLKSTVQKVTVMSCNISNNFEITDKIPPEKYVKLINDAFNTIENVIFKYNGTINRFVGNSVLVYWGYPIHSRKDSENAIKAAIEIEEKINNFNRQFSDGDENFSVSVKIAINTGNALIGQIGSKSVSDFTLLGETVDIIERIEDVCREFGKSVIVTEQTLNQLDEPVTAEYIGQVRLKTCEEKTKIYELKLPINQQNDGENHGDQSAQN